MSYKRREILVTNEVYHIYNRSIAREEIFPSLPHLNRALALCSYYRFKQKIRLSQFLNLSPEIRKSYLNNQKHRLEVEVVKVHAFCFMPNHFHFLLEQVTEDGIKNFVSNFQNGYAKYFNMKHKRDGGLFKSPFQSKLISNDFEFNHVSRYIHLNPVTSYLIEIDELVRYPFTSFPDYVDRKQDSFVYTDKTLSNFRKTGAFISFVNDQSDYQRRIHEASNVLLDGGV